MIVPAAAALVVAAAAVIVARPLAGTLSVSGPTASPVRDLTPLFGAQASDFEPADEPLAITIQVATRPDFVAPLLLDSTVAGAAIEARPTTPLPSGGTIYWRALARTARGAQVVSATVGPRQVAPWVSLLLPADGAPGALQPSRPRFLWTSPRVAAPPGPFEYELRVLPSGPGAPLQTIVTRDTTFVPEVALETNRSYRWAVHARLVGGAPGDTALATSAGTFFVSATSPPRATLLYQNFPNPFPREGRDVTCVWFDLSRPTAVRLEIYDLRGHLVRRIIPGPAWPSLLPSGRYGREPAPAEGGCDPRLTWDGTSDDGRAVRAGVYLLRLRTADGTSVRKILFQGRQ
ncbi:MAG TPA: hypothetical protein VNA89_14530 [Gemmatimonadaceae bacterium]|nr:hypothetical protein [Gemmatimonadaceae bacterium]